MNLRDFAPPPIPLIADKRQNGRVYMDECWELVANKKENEKEFKSMMNKVKRGEWNISNETFSTENRYNCGAAAFKCITYIIQRFHIHPNAIIVEQRTFSIANGNDQKVCKRLHILLIKYDNFLTLLGRCIMPLSKCIIHCFVTGTVSSPPFFLLSSSSRRP